MHYKLLLDPAKYLGPQDFPEPREVTIKRLAREKLPEREGEEKKSAPMLYIQAKDGNEYPRPLKIPKSVLHGLSLALGTDIDQWVGKKVTLYAARCLAFGEVEDCVRVQFADDIEAKILKWMKKRKASPSAYLYQQRA